VKQTTSDGLITVNAPHEEGWSVETVAGVVQAGTSTTFVKCKRTVAGEFLFLMAKDYTVPADNVVTAEQLLRELYPASYAKVFAEVKLDALREKHVHGRAWWEASYSFVHTKLGAITKIERVTCVGEHVLLVSGEGAPAVVTKHFGMLANWLDTAEFKTGAAGTAA
jgi:hypothetical protein